MAISKNGINGTLKGRVGNAVFCNWKGITYVRSLPQPKRKKNRSESTLANQSKFKFIQQHVLNVLALARIGFSYISKNRTAYNWAMSYNLKSAVLSLPERLAVNWETFAFSRDMLNPIYDVRVLPNMESGSILVKWKVDPEFLVKQECRDFRCALLAYPENNSKAFINYVLYGNSLSTGEQEIKLQTGFDIGKYHLYMAFFSTDHSDRVTDSEYLGYVNWD